MAGCGCVVGDGEWRVVLQEGGVGGAGGWATLGDGEKGGEGSDLWGLERM